MKKLIFFSVLFLFCSVSLFSQQRNVAVTVYNNDLAVIKDHRELQLEKGVFELKYKDVAARIDPTSVHFKSLTAPEKVRVFEQNYEYDLVSANKVLNKYIDKTITVHTKQDSIFKGELLSSESGSLILKKEAGNIKLINRSNVVDIDFPKLPEGLITRPTLVWQISNSKPGVHETEVSYMTSGMNWHTEYIAVSKNEDAMLELSAWVSIDNNSGATFPNAKLKLIAGDVNRVYDTMPRREKAIGEAYAMAAAPQFEEKSFFEYHMYTLDKPTTLQNNQVKQVSLFPSAEVSARKIFTFEPRKAADKVRVNLEFANAKKSGLGLPLPAGKVRVYKEDPDDNSLEFIGEDKLDHTPKNEKIRLFLGNAFDIKAERLMLEKKSTGKQRYDETWQIKIRNHKETDVKVTVIEKFYGFWKVKQASHEYKKESAQKLNFVLDVPKDRETVLTFTLSFRRR
ncbi:hypothetical protein B6I21_02760 [candidate division KSB1 bacterium 4572_119]|nr:MAG: hypothetical protein B6I21_02760 [candidate division KSB1 bacterium 4572_119]